MYVLLCFSSILQICPGESTSVCVVMFQFNITNLSWGVNQCMCCYVSVQYYKSVPGSQRLSGTFNKYRSMRINPTTLDPCKCSSLQLSPTPINITMTEPTGISTIIITPTLSNNSSTSRGRRRGPTVGSDQFLVSLSRQQSMLSKNSYLNSSLYSQG